MPPNADLIPDLLADLLTGIIAGNRRALARAITLVESTRDDHRGQAMALLEGARAASQHQSLRIGLSGTPGVGKSTFIEAFGMMLVEQGLRVAVLAVDPSSTRTGGSILGDKTRMPLLSRQASAFIRPSPSQTALGGVARRTRESILLCEAAGFDVILIETVGVGQSETMVADMSDIFVLLLAPAGGDELQGVKRGIMEIADLVLVNKADGVLKSVANRTCADYAGALQLMRKRPQDPDGFPNASVVSALTGDGLAATWAQIQTLAGWRKKTGNWDRARAEQSKIWFDYAVRQGLLAQMEKNETIIALRRDLHQQVANGQISVETAARHVLQAIKSRNGEK